MKNPTNSKSDAKTSQQHEMLQEISDLKTTDEFKNASSIKQTEFLMAIHLRRMLNIDGYPNDPSP